MFLSLISTDSPNYGVRQAKTGLLFPFMYEGHSQQEQQRAVTVPSGLKRPYCTHLVGKHTSLPVPWLPSVTWAFMELHQDLSLGSSRQLGRSSLRTHLGGGAADCNSVGAWWAVLPHLRTFAVTCSDAL